MAADLVLWESAKLMKWGQDPYHELPGVLSPLCAKSSQWGLAGAKVMSGLNLKKVTILAQQNPFVVSMIEPFKTEMAKRGQVLDIVHKEPPRPVA